MNYEVDDIVRLPALRDVLGFEGDPLDVRWPGWHPRMEAHGGQEGLVVVTNSTHISIALIRTDGQRSGVTYSYLRTWLDKVNDPKTKAQLNGTDNHVRKIERKINYLKQKFSNREEHPKVKHKVDNVFSTQKSKLGLQVTASQLETALEVAEHTTAPIDINSDQYTRESLMRTAAYINSHAATW